MKKIPPQKIFAKDKAYTLESLEHLTDGLTKLIPAVLEELRLSRAIMTRLMKKYPQIIVEIFPDELDQKRTTRG